MTFRVLDYATATVHPDVGRPVIMIGPRNRTGVVVSVRVVTESELMFDPGELAYYVLDGNTRVPYRREELVFLDEGDTW